MRKFRNVYIVHVFPSLCAGFSGGLKISIHSLSFAKLTMFGIDDDSAGAFLTTTHGFVYMNVFHVSLSVEKVFTFSWLVSSIAFPLKQSITRIIKMRFSQTVFVRSLFGGSSPNWLEI